MSENGYLPIVLDNLSTGHEFAVQWGRPAVEIPAFIIKRIPFRYTYDNNYFNLAYQGVPKEGYTKLVSNILKNTNVMTNVDIFKNKEKFLDIADTILFTGKIDEFFNYKFGKLEYRSLYFKTKKLKTANYQGVAGMN